MRLIMLLAIVIASAPLFAGCFIADDSGKHSEAHSQQCELLGFMRGTPEHAKCRLELARQATPLGVTPAGED